MNRKMKSVGMWLLLGSLSTGMAYADLSKNESEIDIVQQTGICQGIVKDATGESVIGASVIVKGTTNGTITDIDGNFSLSNVKKGDVIEISFVGYITQTIKWDGTPINIILKVHIPADTRSAFPVISVQSPVSIQCCWQS